MSNICWFQLYQFYQNYLSFVHSFHYLSIHYEYQGHTGVETHGMCYNHN